MKRFQATFSGTITWYNEQLVAIKSIYPSGAIVFYILAEDGQKTTEVWELDEIGTWRNYDLLVGVISYIEEIP